jgi:hypothetical protein
MVAMFFDLGTGLFIHLGFKDHIDGPGLIVDGSTVSVL